MFIFRTFCRVKMTDLRTCVVLATLQALIVAVSCGHHRRSMAPQQGLPVSKGGWRPVVGSGGLLYGSFGTAPLHSQAYKIPIPVIDLYQSSSRPLATKDTTKLTSIAQSYRPTTLRTVQAATQSPAVNQPINTYHNPFAFQGNGFNNYKFVQNFPVESSLVRNPYNPFGGRPVYSKYPTKQKQNIHLQNSMLQQLTNVQPIQFGQQYQTAKPVDIFGKPIENYQRPDNKKPQGTTIETFKPEVFKLPDSETAPQSVQQVKTAQQQGHAGIPTIVNPYQQYSFQDAVLPPNILGTFGSFGIQSVKARDPVFQFPTTKAAYSFSPQTNKQTIFNSFSYSPNFKTTPTIFDSTTPRLLTTANQLHYGTTYSDFKITPTPQTKLFVPPKIDPNAGAKDGFKPSPQDPFTKNHPSNYNKVTVTTYNPTVQTTTLGNNYYNNFQAHQNQQLAQPYHERETFNYENKKHKIHDSVAAGGNQQSQQYANVPTSTADSAQNYPKQPTYEVTETTESDANTPSSATPWALTSQPYEHNQDATEESAKKNEYADTDKFSRPTSATDLPEEYAIVTEAEKGHDNSLSYDGQVESQSRRPPGEDFEPIGKHKLKDYYYKVSTPSYNDQYTTSRRTKKPHGAKYSTQETTTQFDNNRDNNDDIQVEALPTLPPTLHFKRPTTPSTVEPLDKDKIRKRNKIRRRRPQHHRNSQRVVETTSTSSTSPSTVSVEPIPTTEGDETYTIRPRVRPTKSQPNLTTPTVTTDLTTSALPTVTPTIPTIVKKKLAHRRPVTTPTYQPETTTASVRNDFNKESQIMKISTRPYFPKLNGFDFKNDYSHKQDEKDTPTSDVSVSITDTLKTSPYAAQEFSFHKDVKPLEAKLEPVTNLYRDTTTEFYREETVEYTTTPRPETTTARLQRPRLRNKYNRTRFNVKDYRSRLSSTTSTTEKPSENIPKIRYPQRRLPHSDNENETTTERKRFTPKEPRYKIGNGTDNNEHNERETQSFKPHIRQRERQKETTEVIEATTISTRTRNGQRRPKPQEETTESPPTTIHIKRPLRKKIKDSEIGESVQDVTETTYYDRNEITSERTRSESAIMKIADKKHQDHIENLFEHSKRVSDLTLAASKDYNKPGMFKTVSSNSRRIPNYFTIATDDPILPIEAFFPQLNQKKEA